MNAPGPVHPRREVSLVDEFDPRPGPHEELVEFGPRGEFGIVADALAGIDEAAKDQVPIRAAVDLLGGQAKVADPRELDGLA